MASARGGPPPKDEPIALERLILHLGEESAADKGWPEEVYNNGCSARRKSDFEVKLEAQMKLFTSAILAAHDEELKAQDDKFKRQISLASSHQAQNSQMIASRTQKTQESALAMASESNTTLMRMCFDNWWEYFRKMRIEAAKSKLLGDVDIEQSPEDTSDEYNVISKGSIKRSATAAHLHNFKASTMKANVLYDEPAKHHDTALMQTMIHHTHEAAHLKVQEMTLIQRLVFTNLFEVVSGMIIMCNTIVMALQLQYSGFDAGFDLKDPQSPRPAADTWPGAEVAFFYCNIVFNTLFTIELFLRVGAHRCSSLKSGWIWFDVIVVSVGIVDIVAQDALAFNPGMMRVIRLVRLVRLLKVFQAMSSFDSLFLLLKAMHASQQALIWSFLILGLCQLVVGLFLCQLVQDFIADDTNSQEARIKIFQFFGTFSRSMLTMFEVTMANWVPSCRALAYEVSEFFIIFYIFYRCMFCFAVLKVIAAVFITETNRVLEHDDELTVMKADREKRLFLHKVVKAFHKIDTEGRGKFGWEHLEKLMHDEELSVMITTLGFQKHDFEKLFWLIDDGSGEISINDFVGKMGKLKGFSKTIDILTMLKLVHRMDQKIQHLLEKLFHESGNDLEIAEEELACRV